MRYDNLPIYKSALNLCVYTETIVKNFDKYYKYTIGEDLRNTSKELLFLIHRANISIIKQEQLENLKNRCEDLKMLISLAKELKAFKSFKQFEYISKLTIEVCKQSQGWLNSSANKNNARVLK
jgi:hypothetical protein